MGRLFGTDGARGVANSELTCELAMNIGRAAAMVLTDNDHRHPKILIGKDTRLSSDMLENALTAGLCSVGANVVQLGVVPTPAVAFLVGKYKADAGVMISASHNPCEFNGIKIFSGDGYKLPDALEEQIEAIVLDEIQPFPCPTGGDVGKVLPAPNVVRDYVDHIKATVAFSLDGMEIAVDCANGSASRTAELLFTELGAKVHMLNAEPNGVNINDNCGSTHLGQLKERVRRGSFDLGVAFDGDADRCLIVDETGEELDGDRIMAVCAAHMKKQGKLRGGAFVATILSNMGLHAYAEKNGMKIECSNVGDRYVLEMMLKKGYILGGEQSGHVIFLEYASTGDGELTALQFMSILKESGRKCSEIAAEVVPWPQVMINVKVPNDQKATLQEKPEIKADIEAAAAELGDNGRILVRPSGTEALVRVMVEGKDSAQVDTLAKRVAKTIESVV